MKYDMDNLKKSINMIATPREKNNVDPIPDWAVLGD